MPVQPDLQSANSNSARSFLSFFLAWIFIAGLAILSIAALKPPRPQAMSAPENEFSAERAFVHVREIARVPHPIGSAANGAARDYLLAQLSRFGVQASVYSSMGINPTAHLINPASQIVIGGKTNDIVGLLPGAAAGPAIMLMAHYDSVIHASGAGDDAAGVAAILEVARALRAGPALQRDVIILFTDGEEPGLLGAEAFAHGHPWAKNVGLILNFDARGDRGPSLLFETSANNAGLVEAAARYAPHPIGSSLFYELYKLLPNDTDFSVFRPSGVSGLNFAFGEGLWAYHSPLDTPDRLSLASLQHHGSYGLALARHFGQTDLAFKQFRGDDIFFDWYGDRMIAYRQSWVLPGQVLVTLLLAAAFVVAFRRRAVQARRFLLALLACLAIVAAVIAAAAAGWWLIALVLADRRLISDSLANTFLLSGLVFLSVLVGALLLAWVRRRLGLQEMSLAALSLWCVLSWLLALTLPSGSYLFFWPLLLGVAGYLSGHLHRAGANGPSIRDWPAVIAAILLFAPVIYLLYIFLTLQIIFVAASAFLVALFLLLSIPLFEAPAGAALSRNVITPGIAAVACLACGMVLSGHTPSYPRPDTIIYSLNTDENSAAWITYDQKPDGWTRQFFLTNAQGPQPIEKYLAGLSRPLLAAKAPVLPLLPPVMENVEHTQAGGVHRLKFKIRSQRNAGALYLRFLQDVQPVSMKVAGRDIPVHKGGRFGLTWFGLGNESLELEFEVAGPSVSLWLMDRSNNLPVDVPPRPADLIIQDGSDVTFVCRKYTL
jgi:hypothetical protein